MHIYNPGIPQHCEPLGHPKRSEGNLLDIPGIPLCWDKHYTLCPQVPAWRLSCHHPNKKSVLKFTSHGFDLGANPGDFEKGIWLRNHLKLWWFGRFNHPHVNIQLMVYQWFSIFLSLALSWPRINHLPSIVHDVHMLDVMTRCFTWCVSWQNYPGKRHQIMRS